MAAIFGQFPANFRFSGALVGTGQVGQAGAGAGCRCRVQRCRWMGSGQKLYRNSRYGRPGRPAAGEIYPRIPNSCSAAIGHFFNWGI